MVRDKRIMSIFRMIRPVNLLIIITSQVFVRYFIISPLLANIGSKLPLGLGGFILLVSATVLIAAAGYIINDTLDQRIDRVNKPDKVASNAVVSEDLAEYLYYGLNVLGIIAGTLVSWMVGKLELAIIFVIIATILYYYSFKYKYLTFWGNLIISLLTSSTLLIVWLFEFFAFRNAPGDFVDAFPAFQLISVFVGSYALFAFITTISREITKDIEDREGDAKNGCMTIPVRFGLKMARTSVNSLNFLTLLLLLIFQYLSWSYNFTLLSIVLLIAEVLLIFIIIQTFKSSTSYEFHRTGNMLKLLMFIGILSMIFISIRPDIL